jgi:DNA-binding response OmpR family regulator
MIAPSSRPPPYNLAGAAAILVVDDDPEVRRSVRRALERDGHRLLEASTLAQAQIAFANTAIELVILDLALPDGSGLSLLREIGQQPVPAAVIVLTGSGDRRLSGRARRPTSASPSIA